MTYSVLIAPRVYSELDQAVGYISSELDSPRAAAQLLDAFENTIHSLETNPFAYPVNRHLSGIVRQPIRCTRVRNYRLCYRVHEDAHRVDALYFKHMRQDEQTYLESYN